MTRSRALALVLFAFVPLATEVGPVRADVAPWPFKPKRPYPIVPEPAPPQPPNDPVTGQPMREFREDKPKRTGPFRSCGSGMGVGLAGIGAACAVLWLGMRFARAARK